MKPSNWEKMTDHEKVDWIDTTKPHSLKCKGVNCIADGCPLGLYCNVYSIDRSIDKWREDHPANMARREEYRKKSQEPLTTRQQLIRDLLISDNWAGNPHFYYNNAAKLADLILNDGELPNDN